MPHSKLVIRQNLLKIRKNIPAQQAEEHAVRAAENFIRFVKINSLKSIASYHPVNGEISPLPLLELLFSKFVEREITFALPVVMDKNSPLEFHPWKIGQKLVENSLYPNILQPEIFSLSVMPELIIVPLVAFDEYCNRIGYGGGFYDRTFAKLLEYNDILKVGYAYECQKINYPIAIDKHDIKLDLVVTEQRVYARGKVPQDYY